MDYNRKVRKKPEFLVDSGAPKERFITRETKTEEKAALEGLGVGKFI